MNKDGAFNPGDPMGDNTDFVTLTIDGRQTRVPRGTTILQAAAGLGEEIPHYCYHPGLSSPGMCRLCLVEVEGAPKPMPSCVTAAVEGQVVHTQSTLALDMRRGVLEFYAVNHPLDCPICDMSGECYFQDNLHLEGRDESRFRDRKRVLGRDDFGGDVLFYADRCVMCTRCVRFMNEVEQEERLTVVGRGDRSIIDTFFSEGLDGTHWHGNIVDLCPVGALVSKDFLYKARAWDLEHTDSICPNCSQGCNISLHTRDNLVQRVKPRPNPAVNGHWMCDYGRLKYEWINRGGRLETPRVRQDGAFTPGGWRESLSGLLARLRAPGGGDDTHRGDMVGRDIRAVVSPFCSNEDLGALKALVDHLGGGSVVYECPEADTEVTLKGFPQLARRRDLAPNATGADLLGFTRLRPDDARAEVEAVSKHRGIIFVLGDVLPHQNEDFGADAALYVYLGTHHVPAAHRAAFVLPVTTFAESEGTFTNVEKRVQRFHPALEPPGVAKPAWLVLGAILAELSGSKPPRSAADSYADLASRVPAFAGAGYDGIGTGGALLAESIADRHER